MEITFKPTLIAPWTLTDDKIICGTKQKNTTKSVGEGLAPPVFKF